MILKKCLPKFMGLVLLSITGAALAVPPSVANTSWNLSGKFKGRAKVKCAQGGSQSVPIAGMNNIKANIRFDDGAILGDGQGTFTWSDTIFAPLPVTGTWDQTGARIDLEFNNWYDSPMSVFAYGLAKAFAQLPNGFNFHDSVTGSVSPWKVTKLTFFATINGKGKKIKVKETLGFKFDALAAGLGSSNACSFSFPNLGRSYKGLRAQ
jgi:hypothetical protein